MFPVKALYPLAVLLSPRVNASSVFIPTPVFPVAALRLPVVSCPSKREPVKSAPSDLPSARPSISVATFVHERFPAPFVESTCLLVPSSAGKVRSSITTCPVPFGEIEIFPSAPSVMVIFPVEELPVCRVRS